MRPDDIAHWVTTELEPELGTHFVRARWLEPAGAAVIGDRYPVGLYAMAPVGLVEIAVLIEAVAASRPDPVLVTATILSIPLYVPWDEGMAAPLPSPVTISPAGEMDGEIARMLAAHIHASVSRAAKRWGTPSGWIRHLEYDSNDEPEWQELLAYSRLIRGDRRRALNDLHDIRLDELPGVAAIRIADMISAVSNEPKSALLRLEAWRDAQLQRRGLAEVALPWSEATATA